MFKGIVAGVSLVVIFTIAMMSCTYVDQGKAGVLVDRGSSGIHMTPLASGLHTKIPGKQFIVEIPWSMRTLKLEAPRTANEPNTEINVNTIESQHVAMDVQMDYTLDPNRTPFLYKKFRTNIETVEANYFTATIKGALNRTVGQDSLSKLMGPDKERIRAETQKFIQDNLEQYGVQISQFTITGVHPDTAILRAISEQNQMKTAALTAQNHLEQAKYEADAVRIAAQGQADANKLLTESASPRVIQMRAIEAWQAGGSQVPTYMSGNVSPIPFHRDGTEINKK